MIAAASFHTLLRYGHAMLLRHRLMPLFSFADIGGAAYAMCRARLRY